MKKLICMTLVLLMLSGCVALEEEILPTSTSTASPSASPTVSATLSPSTAATPLSTASPTLRPSPSPSQPPCPDIVFSDEPAANSAAMLYEDAENIYDSIHGWLFQIRKSDGSMTEISEYCSGFTMLDGIVYYVTCGEGEAYDTIAQYNPSTGKSKTVLRPGNDVFEIAAYGHKLYFSYATEAMPYADPEPSDLYSCDPDGSHMKMVREDVYGFCIVRDTVYYTLGSCNDGTPLYACALDGSSARELYGCVDWTFDAEGEWLHVYTGDSIVRNLSSGEEISLPSCETCVLAGQYAFYVTYDTPSVLCALDLNTRLTYTLAQLPEGHYGLEATGQAVYLCDYTMGLISRISVQNGAVRLDTTVQLGMDWN